MSKFLIAYFYAAIYSALGTHVCAIYTMMVHSAGYIQDPDWSGK